MTIFFLIALMMLPDPAEREPPLPPIQWEGRFSFTGRPPRDARGFQRIIVVQGCQPKRFQDWEAHRAFCEVSGKVTGRPDFCFSTGLKTKERCNDILDQNAESFARRGKIINYSDLLPVRIEQTVNAKK